MPARGTLTIHAKKKDACYALLQACNDMGAKVKMASKDTFTVDGESGAMWMQNRFSARFHARLFDNYDGAFCNKAVQEKHARAGQGGQACLKNLGAGAAERHPMQKVPVVQSQWLGVLQQVRRPDELSVQQVRPWKPRRLSVLQPVRAKALTILLSPFRIPLSAHGHP